MVIIRRGGESAPAENPQVKDARNISSIQFPYNDLEDAIDIVKKIHENGGVSCSPDQLAAAMKQVPTSGTFRLKVSAARIFGLVSTSAGRVSITDLGFEITDPTRERAAKVRAFMNVELYNRVYEEFKGRQLPPRPAAFELMLEKMGVSPKQKDKARIALDRSAADAGFYAHGKDRLVLPNVDVAKLPHDHSVSIDTPAGAKQDDPPSSSSWASRGGTPERHPFIEGLLKTLPEPETNWAIEGRAKWLQAAANIFDLIYKGTGEISVRATQKD